MIGNNGALAFYRAMGGREGDIRETELFGQKVQDLPIYWDDLERLAAA